MSVLLTQLDPVTRWPIHELPVTPNHYMCFLPTLAGRQCARAGRCGGGQVHWVHQDCEEGRLGWSGVACCTGCRLGTRLGQSGHCVEGGQGLSVQQQVFLGRCPVHCSLWVVVSWFSSRVSYVCVLSCCGHVCGTCVWRVGVLGVARSSTVCTCLGGMLEQERGGVCHTCGCAGRHLLAPSLGKGRQADGLCCQPCRGGLLMGRQAWQQTLLVEETSPGVCIWGVCCLGCGQTYRPLLGGTPVLLSRPGKLPQLRVSVCLGQVFVGRPQKGGGFAVLFSHHTVMTNRPGTDRCTTAGVPHTHTHCRLLAHSRPRHCARRE
jgi:hypothetical protein